jgi:hypothetical protein
MSLSTIDSPIDNNNDFSDNYLSTSDLEDLMLDISVQPVVVKSSN